MASLGLIGPKGLSVGGKALPVCVNGLSSCGATAAFCTGCWLLLPVYSALSVSFLSIEIVLSVGCKAAEPGEPGFSYNTRYLGPFWFLE